MTPGIPVFLDTKEGELLLDERMDDTIGFCNMFVKKSKGNVHKLTLIYCEEILLYLVISYNIIFSIGKSILESKVFQNNHH